MLLTLPRHHTSSLQRYVAMLQAEKVGSETTLAQIVQLVEKAQMSKAPIQALADRISSIFVPIILAVAFATWLAWFVAGMMLSFAADMYPLWIPCHHLL